MMVLSVYEGTLHRMQKKLGLFGKCPLRPVMCNFYPPRGCVPFSPILRLLA